MQYRNKFGPCQDARTEAWLGKMDSAESKCLTPAVFSKCHCSDTPLQQSLYCSYVFPALLQGWLEGAGNMIIFLAHLTDCTGAMSRLAG